MGPLDEGVAQMLEQVRLPICVTNPSEDDNPIVYVNAAFLELTGYDADEVLGRNCRFLQGEGTTRESIEAVRRAVGGGEVTTVEIVNYRKDGTRFDNALQIGPILDADGKTLLHFGSQLDVTDKRAEERAALALETQERTHRLRNIINVMAVTVRMTAREVDDIEEFAEIVTDRLRVLGDAHIRTFESGSRTTLRETLETILTAYAPHGAEQYGMEGPEVPLDPSQITPLTLALHELSTNAIKYGAFGTRTGRVEVNWAREGDRVRLTWTERGGPEVKTPAREGGSGIVRSVLRNAGDDIAYDWAPEGVTITLTFAA